MAGTWEWSVSQTHVLHLVSMGAYAAALLGFIACVARPDRRLAAAGLAVGGLGVAANVAALVERGREVGQAPFQAIYEICLLIGAVPMTACTVVYLGMRFHQSRGTRARVGAGLGALSALTALMATGLALWAGDRHLTLPPALRSGWFVPHVGVYVVAYGLLALAALAGLVYLALHYVAWRRRGALGTGPASADLLDALGYALASVGFAFLTLGLVFGALWAQAAWGAWWSWDVKETWALLGWLVYVAYLHLRLVRGWSRVGSAWLLFLGGAAILVCFLFLDILPGSSPHKYT
jgi:cytochrome c-type biogenesis protein CcsB